MLQCDQALHGFFAFLSPLGRVHLDHLVLEPIFEEGFGFNESMNPARMISILRYDEYEGSNERPTADPVIAVEFNSDMIMVVNRVL